MQMLVLHAAVAFGRNCFTDDPVTIINLREGKHTVRVAGNGLDNLSRQCFDQAECHTGNRLTRWVYLEIGDPLRLIGDRRYGLPGIHIALIQRNAYAVLVQ